MICNEIKLITLIVITFYYCNCYNINDTYKLIKSPHNADGMQFGYSIALGSETILIGSPKDDNNNGVVYKCDINNECHVYLMDGITENMTSCSSITKGHLFGASLKMLDNKMLISCAPNWYFCKSATTHYVTGICIKTDMDKNNSEVLSYTTKDVSYNYIEGLKFKYGYGVFGLSAFIDENEDILTGSPGVADGVGTIFINENDVLDPLYKERGLSEYIDSYIGYSVISGKFGNDDMLYIAGAPRHNIDKSGLVIIIKPNDNEKIVQKLTSNLTFSYFGSSLAIAKITGIDNKLIVGAPTCEKGRTECGCVHIYDYVGSKFLLRKIVFGEQFYSRYGAAISNLGKVDYDEYDDVAVAAPYEDYGNGAVYVYYGSSAGDWEFFDRLTPEPTTIIKGFGFSLSNGYDYDGNGLNDVAVGCVKCNNVYVFLSKKVIALDGTITSNINNIANERKFQITFCMKTNYHQHKIPNVSVALNFFNDESYIKNTKIENEVFVINNGKSCKKIEVKLGDVDVRPKHLNVYINYTYIEYCDKSSCAVESRENKQFVGLTIPFIHECGSDKKCQFAFKFRANFEESPIVYGKNSTLIVNYKIRNEGPELMPKFNIIFNSTHAMELVLHDKLRCDTEMYKISCKHEKIRVDKEISEKIKIKFNDLKLTTEEINLLVTVSSEGQTKSAKLIKKIVKDYNVTMSTLFNNTINVIVEDMEFLRHFSIVNTGLTDEVNAELIIEYNLIKYRKIQLDDLNCTSLKGRIICNLTKLHNVTFAVLEKYEYDLAKDSNIDTIDSKFNITIKTSDNELFNGVYVTTAQILTSNTVIISISTSLIAILLGIILVYSLWRCGFFKRKKFDEMNQSLKAESMYDKSDGEEET